jgi:8-oxo-dGTP pyrophosphatase MutT (NUDIX family)
VPLITSAFALAFRDQSILMTNLNARGWDIPGGHIEAGESPEATMHREVMEETGAQLETVRLLGYQRIHLLCSCPPNYRYPHPDSYQVLYIATIADLLAFLPTEETRERALFAPNEASSLRWVQENREMYDAALSLIMNAA